MGILYESTSINIWAVWIFVVFALMAFNEFSRSTRWGGITMFILVPIVLTIFVWPKTAAPGNEYGTGNWFTWVKTYSALAGCIGFMALRYIPSLAKKKWALLFPPLILGINIFEAAIRDFQVFTYGAWNGEYINNLWVMSGPWNIMNGIAGILNVVAICGWVGIFISKDRTKDMIWPDMTWMWIIAYDIWNLAYTYNCIADHSFYCGAALLVSATIPAFFIKRGAWLQHRAHTLAFWAMFVMTIPMFADRLVPVKTTHNPTAFFVLSLLALIANAALVIYQFMKIKKNKMNPLRDEIYAGSKDHTRAVEINS